MEPRTATTTRRGAAWSGPLTRWLARRIPPERREVALDAVKVVHTALFVSIGACVTLFAVDGVRQRRGVRAGVALAVALAESGVYVSNNQVCPLTPLAEELGAGSGSVADLFLPGWLSRRIPMIGGSLLVIGVGGNAFRMWRAPVAEG